MRIGADMFVLGEYSASVFASDDIMCIRTPSRYLLSILIHHIPESEWVNYAMAFVLMKMNSEYECIAKVVEAPTASNPYQFRFSVGYPIPAYEFSDLDLDDIYDDPDPSGSTHAPTAP